MKWKQWAACVLLFSVCLMAAACGQAPQKAAAPRADHYAVIHTNMGNITLQLYDSKAPVTTENFEKLANDGFMWELFPQSHPRLHDPGRRPARERYGWSRV